MFLRADIDFSSSNGQLQYTLRQYNACFNFERGKKNEQTEPFRTPTGAKKPQNTW